MSPKQKRQLIYVGIAVAVAVMLVIFMTGVITVVLRIRQSLVTPQQVAQRFAQAAIIEGDANKAQEWAAVGEGNWSGIQATLDAWRQWNQEFYDAGLTPVSVEIEPTEIPRRAETVRLNLRITWQGLSPITLVLRPALRLLVKSSSTITATTCRAISTLR